jgi:hypothetical protein
MWRRYHGQARRETLLVRGHRDGRKDRYGLGLGLVLFRLVVHSLQRGAVGSYLVWGERFSSHLLLEGIGQ